MAGVCVCVVLVEDYLYARECPALGYGRVLDSPQTSMDSMCIHCLQPVCLSVCDGVCVYMYSTSQKCFFCVFKKKNSTL
jgi:hypothetical protein